jgi:hypothetical protein
MIAKEQYIAQLYQHSTPPFFVTNKTIDVLKTTNQKLSITQHAQTLPEAAAKMLNSILYLYL